MAEVTQLVELSKYQLNGLLYPLIGIFFDLSMMGPDGTCGKNEPQLAAERLLRDRFQRALPRKVQLQLAHRSAQSQQQAIIDDPRVINAVRVDDQRADQSAQFDQIMPVSPVPGQT